MTDQTQHRRALVIHLAFSAIVLFGLLALLEILSLVFGLTVGKRLFSDESDYFHSIDAKSFEAWQSSPWYDGELGWRLPRIAHTEDHGNCLDEKVTYKYDGGVRLSAGPSAEPGVAIFGESYAYGQEIDDDATIASALWRRFDTGALNFGTPGYSPEQAVLNFERLLKERKMPPRAVLLIMHENVRRTANSFRPAYLAGSDIPFGMKPYMLSGKLFPLSFPGSFGAFIDEAFRRFASDYWARPEFTFPYSLSLIKALYTKSFYLRYLASLGNLPFTYEYSSDNDLRRNITVIVQRFRDDAIAAGIKPFVIFIPQSKATYRVSSEYASALDKELGGGTVSEFEDQDIDWSRYNLKPDGNCHPSPYGADRIAKFIGERLGL